MIRKRAKNDIKMINERNSSIELLRIVAMLMIVLCHMVTHGNVSYIQNSISIPRLWYNLIAMGGNIGTNLFVIITGYYLIESKSKFYFFRVLCFIFEVLFYSIIIYIILISFKIIPFNISKFIKAFFPITYQTWWFASAYFVLYIFHPFLNKMLSNITKEQFKFLLMLEILFWSIIPTFLLSHYQSNNLLWLATLYCISAYYKKYGIGGIIPGKEKYLICISFLLLYISSILIIYIRKIFNINNINPLFFYDRQSFFILVISFFLFVLFLRLKIHSQKWINVISSTTFGVYLIHDNPDVRHILWTYIFDITKIKDSVYFPLYTIFILFYVFITCSIIDMLRQIIINICCDSLKEKISKKINLFWGKFNIAQL